jgi:hypothetical protein
LGNGPRSSACDGMAISTIDTTLYSYEYLPRLLLLLHLKKAIFFSFLREPLVTKCNKEKDLLCVVKNSKVMHSVYAQNALEPDHWYIQA